MGNSLLCQIIGNTLQDSGVALSGIVESGRIDQGYISTAKLEGHCRLDFARAGMQPHTNSET